MDVPRPQRRNFGRVYQKPATRLCAPARALRGFLTTTLIAFASLAGPALAHAQSTGRFADVPSAAPEKAATPAAPAVSPPPPISAPPSRPPASNEPPVGFTRRLAQNHFERALVLEERGDVAQALSEYSRAIEIDSTWGDAYLRLGALRERMGDPREADLVYSIAVRLTDTRVRALVQRSHLRRNAGLGADALHDLEAAIAIADDDRSLLAELAQDYVERHAWSAALAVFRRIASLANESGETEALTHAKLEVRALRVLAAETDATREHGAKHDWVQSALASIARR